MTNRTPGRPWLAIGVCLLTAYVAAFSAYAYRSLPRLGYIDSTVLLSRHREAIEARKAVEAKAGDLRTKMRTLELELRELNREDLTRGATGASASRQAEVARRQEELVRYTRAASDDIARTERETMQPVFSALNAAISDFGKERGYDLILGTLAGGNVLSATRRYDLTEEFLAFLEARR